MGKVDMVLLAGDLFHDNKPSRKALFQVMRSLRMNCLGEKPCELEMLSDASDIFEGAFAHVNYEDPDINVAIPVFSIHGNHDDPSGDGHFCSLDLLQVSGLLNYFGRTPESDNISIKPVLLQKGQTKLALYGMSNVRDERLFRTFRDGKVKFFKPGVQQSDWFNLMAVHQNHHAHTETGYLPENFLPEFLDLVVWGHEHECLIDPRLNPETMFHVMQPGSSVATSLVPGEAVPKHVAIVNVTGKDFKIEKHRLKTVRPFITSEIVLSEDKRFKHLAKQKENKQNITLKLMDVVNELIEEAKAEWLECQDDDEDEELQTPLPLVRLKVEYTAPEGGKFDCENPQRFSNRFVGKVANVNDVVQFFRKKRGGAARGKNDKGEMPEESILASMSIDTVKIERLVQEFLTAQSLKILPQAPFGDAVTQFVDKDDKHAMETFVDESLAGQVKDLLDLDDEDDDIESAMERYRTKVEEQFNQGIRKARTRRGQLKPRPQNWDSDLDGEWDAQPGAYEIPDIEQDETPAPPTRRGRGPIASDASDDESVMPAPAKKASAKRAPAKKPTAKATAKAPAKKAAAKAPVRGRKKVAALSADEDDEEDVVMMDHEPPPKPKAQPKRAAAARSTGRQTQLSFSQVSQASKGRAKELSDDEISDDDDAFEPMVASSSSRRR
jgi:double-strand break repair protein MRE11